jgi:hypothetical protein
LDRFIHTVDLSAAIVFSGMRSDLMGFDEYVGCGVDARPGVNGVAPASKPARRQSNSSRRRSEDREIFQQRNDADDDHDDLDDLLRPPIDRQTRNEIENKNDDQESYQYSDQYR